MAKLKSLSDIEGFLKGLIDKANRREKKKELAEATVERIRERTRAGFGVKETGGQQRRLKPLASRTVQDRGRLRSKGQLSSQTAPARSNITRTGKLLDSLDYRLTRDGYVVFVRDGQDDKVVGLSNLGYDFLNLSDKEISELLLSIFEEIKE